jgi:hypothetical protein
MGIHLKLLGILFGCWHRHLSFPMSMKPGQNQSKAGRRTGTYVVCLDCGKEFSYDWEQMRVLGEGERPLNRVAVVQQRSSGVVAGRA